jgi:glyoxylase-like metal-dependent hydrolase (beta-lactamase superfamily II)
MISGLELGRDSTALAWFCVREVVSGVWLLGEPQHVYTWLVAGDERAVLLDTGMGILPIRPVAASVNSLPLSVVNTHYHFDHIGGNHEFDEIAIHEIGAPLIEQSVPRELLDAYVDYAQRQLDALSAYRQLDAEYFWLLSTESEPRPFPAGFDGSAWTIEPTKATQTLAHGDRIDLGGRVLTVIEGPGHSPDGICLLDERNGLLFGGDTINHGPIYAHFPDSDLDMLVASTRRLAELGDAVQLIFVHHYGHAVADNGFLNEVAQGVQSVQAGEETLVPARDILGGPCLEARFEHFSVTLPDPDAPAPTLTSAE